MIIRVKIWVENSDKKLLIGRGKSGILGAIKRTGSIKAAANELNISYRKCWSQLKTIQDNFQNGLVTTKQGGGEQAGTTLSPFATEFIKLFDELEKEVNEFTQAKFKELFAKFEPEKLD